VVDLDTQESPREVGYDNLRVPEREGVTAAKIAG
jgi:hypothetical protein